MNVVVLKGYAGNNPEVREFNKNKVARFRLATGRSTKNKEGQWVTETDWHTITAFSNVAETVSKFVAKGSEVLVRGNIRYSSYEKEGQTMYRTEIIAESVEICGRVGNSANNALADDAAPAPAPKAKKAPKPAEVVEQDLPF